MLLMMTNSSCSLGSFLLIGVLGFVLGGFVAWLEHRWSKNGSAQVLWLRIVLCGVLVAIVSVLLVLEFGFSVQAYTYIVLTGLLGAAVLTDLDSATIPNKFIVAGIALWLATVWFIPVSRRPFGIGCLLEPFFEQGFVAVALDGLLGAVVVAGSVLMAAVVYEQVTSKLALGGGDIKLLFVAGLFLGFFGSIFNLFLACVAGLVFAFVLRVRAKQRNKKKAVGQKPPHTFPFGPAIAFSTIATLLAGFSVLGWYFG